MDWGFRNFYVENRPFAVFAPQSVRVGLPILPKSAWPIDGRKTLSSYFDSAMIIDDNPAPRGMSFHHYMRHHTDDTLAFGGRSGGDFLVRNVR